MLDSLSKTRTGMRMALGVARALPRRGAEMAVPFVASRMMADPTSVLSRAVRSNQYVVSGGTLTGPALEAAARENVRNMGRFLYDLYHVLGNTDAEEAIVMHDEVFEGFLERERAEGPFVYVGVHLGNFDLVGRSLGRAGFGMQVLSVPDPNGGYKWQNDVRDEAGFEVTPVSMESLKAASRRLEAGGSVLTGIDRPLDEPDKVQPRFFGHPSPLPLLHVRLAMRAHLPVIAFTTPRTSDGRYRLLASDPIPIEVGRPTPELLLVNAERCLAAVEPWIAERPTQWAMPHVVWPDVTVPG